MRQRLAAILAADAVGYSRLMALDARATVEALDAARQVFRSHIESNQGRVIDMAGDSVLAVFETATGAVTAALAVQSELAARGADLAEDRRMRFRIGVHLGDLIEKVDGTVYGDGVNIAARLEGLAEPGGITVSESVRTAVKGKVDAGFKDKGEQAIKNIADPVRIWWLHPLTMSLQSAITQGAGGTSLAAITGIDMSAPVAGFGGRPAIAVLPFDNLSGDPEQEYFADGLAEDILTRLAMWRWVPVIARNSSFAYKGRAVDVKEIGRALGARYVLEGSVRKAGNRVRVTGQLIDAETGHHLWAERYDRVLEDLFAIQDELTDGIVGALESAVGHAETERAHVKPPASLDAWDLCQRAFWHLWRFTREDFAIAEPLLRRAVELDSGLPQAHLGLAILRMYEAFFLWTATPGAALVQAAASAQAALALDSQDPNAHCALAATLAFGRKLDEALALCHKGIAINPSSALGYSALFVTHMYRGEPLLGIAAIETAIRISPNDALLPMWLSSLSAVHYLARHYEKAEEVARLAVQRAPNYPIGWRGLANALGQTGKLDEAREALARFLALMPGYATEQAARVSAGFRDEAVFQHYLEGLRKAGWTG
jgi:adenylate cyclase